MRPERYQRIKEVLFGASRRRGADRSAFLDAECGGDAELRREVERLLESDVPTGQIVPPDAAPPAARGPYRIVRELGRGGMGVVYEATDARTGERVAIKIVHPHLLAAPRLPERLRREARLGRQVEHKNVVRTLDAGDDFLVMEYVEGRTLRELLRDLGTVPERLVREIAIQVAAGLAAIHAAGIVHRDLKPENVLIAADDRVRIMDLGVAKLQEASVDLTKEGQFVGSLHYAAPEQCGMGEVGPAADLYSLGVALYELATGDNPFRHDSPGAVIRAHLETFPPLASEKAPSLSSFLGEVLATLLAKDPARRFASARALEDVLREGESGAWWAERERAAAVPRVPVHRETALHGRGRQLAELKEAWREACAGRGGAILVEGEAGLGKSRLVDALLRELPADVHVLYGSYPPSGGMRGLCEALLARFGAARLEVELRPRLARAPDLVPAFAAFLRKETPPQPLGREQLGDLACQLLQSLARERPTLWVVEDLHFAPEAAREVAAAMARAAQGHRALLLLTARPGVEGYRKVELSRLSPREVVELLRDAFRNEELADRLGARIAYKSDGVPFFVFEMIRGLQEGQFLERLPDGQFVQTRVIDDIEVPSKVKDLIGVRLRDLSRDERAILDVASVLGYEFDADLVAAALERPLVRVLQDLAEVERAHGVVCASGRLYRFDHHQIQEVVYAELPPRLREEYHALVAEAGARAGQDAIFLASHHLRGSRPREGLPHLAAALQRLDQRQLNAHAADLAERALPLLEGQERFDALLAQTSRLELLGRREPQRAAAEETVRLAEETGDPALRARAYRALSTYHWSVSEAAKAMALIEQAREISLAAGDRSREAQDLHNLATNLQRLGRRGEAGEKFRSCRELARETGNRVVEAAATHGLALLAIDEARYREAIGESALSRDLARELGNRRYEAHAEAVLALAHFNLGNFARARPHLDRQLELARELGDRRLEAIAEGNLGLLVQALGRYAEALGHERTYLELAREVRDRRGEALCLQNTAETLILVGDLDAAREHLERALPMARELGDPRLIGATLVRCAQLESFAGDAAAAAARADEALAALEGTGDRFVITEALLLVGRTAEAAALAREIDVPGLLMVAAAREGDAATALACAGRATHAQRLEARWLLWKATGDRAHLDEAQRLLRDALDHAPAGSREAMLANVPVHRALAAEHGERPPPRADGG